MKQGAKYKGYTLIEILIVVSILGIVALAAIPSFTSSNDKYLEVASVEVQSLLRFARNEAIRTGEYHGALVDIASGIVSAVQVSVVAGNVAATTTLIHPVDKKDYTFNVGDIPFASGTSITNVAQPFTFLGFAVPLPLVMFDAQGLPMFIFIGQRYLLTDGTISLGYGALGKDVVLSTAGRVTVQ